LAADGRPGYAVVDEALFDDDAIVSTTRDVRSVGEMLVDVDYLARQLLIDVTGDDAGHLLRGWPDVVFAAADVWNALPPRRDPVTGEPEPDMDRLLTFAEGIKGSLRTGWPGIGVSDPRATQIADTLARAARMVERYAGEIPAERAAVRQDLDAARTRIMHGLYVTAHAVGVALYQHGRDRYRDASTTGRPLPLSTRRSPHAVGPAGQWIQRLAVCERAAGSYLNDNFKQALAGEATRPVGDPGRLGRALTAWDIQAHRTLASAPTPTSVLLVTRTQGLIAGAGLVLVDAAARANLLPTSTTVAERLLPAINHAGRAWSNLASRWSDLKTPAARLEVDLVRAAAEVRAASRELTHDKTTMASLDEISTRPGLDRAVTAILHALEAGSELAYIVSEQADNPNLTGPARALSIRAHNDVETGLLSPHYAAGDIVWVSPADIVARRHIALPPPVAEALRRAGDAATQAAAAAAAAAAPVGLTSTPERADARPPAATGNVDRTPKVEEAMQVHRPLPARGAIATHLRYR
jgi:hypothetical protein